jgi:hypothetical protein
MHPCSTRNVASMEGSEMILLLACIGLTAIPPSMESHQAQDRPARPLVAELEAMKKSFPQGTVPTFRLKIKNIGKAAEKFLRLRGDLQDTYYDLEVSQNGKAAWVSRAISDPGPITDADYAMLKPGESITLELTRFASAWASLPPGEYTAIVRVWRPDEKFDMRYASTVAAFQISK